MCLHSERRMTRRWAKIGPPLPEGQFILSGWLASQPKGGHNRIAAGVVTTLAQATSLRHTPFLSSGYPVVMTMLSNVQERL